MNEAEDFMFQTKYAQRDIGGRIATTILNNVLNTFFTVVNHEVHGHGFRLQSLGIPASYSIKNLGVGGGVTSYRPNRLLSADESLMITMGGSEANNILAQQLLFKNFQNLSLDRRTYGLFLEAYMDLLTYILATYSSEEVSNRSGNDVTEYIQEINHKHHAKDINIDKLMKGSLVFLLNPALHIAWWAQLDYLFTGKDTFTIPHLKLNRINYMPLIRMGLTPFGLIYYVENYIEHDHKTFLVSISGGRSPYYTRGCRGIQLQTARLWVYKNYSLDIKGNLWYQPKLQLQVNDQIKDKNY